MRQDMEREPRVLQKRLGLISPRMVDWTPVRNQSANLMASTRAAVAICEHPVRAQFNTHITSSIRAIYRTQDPRRYRNGFHPDLALRMFYLGLRWYSKHSISNRTISCLQASDTESFLIKYNTWQRLADYTVANTLRLGIEQ